MMDCVTNSGRVAKVVGHFAAALCLAMAWNCGNGGGGNAADAGAGAGVGGDTGAIVQTVKPAKCTVTGIDYAAQIQVATDHPIKDAEPNQIASGGVTPGQNLDTTFHILNNASLQSGYELIINSITLNYPKPAGVTEAASPWQCLVDDGTGKTVPCEGYVFAVAVPPGFDKDCAEPKSSENVTFILRYTRPSDQIGRCVSVLINHELGPTDPQKKKTFTAKVCAVAGAPKLSVSPLEVDFGTVKLGEDATRTVSIANVGTAPLTVTNLELALNDLKPFSMQIGDQTYPGGYNGPLKKPLVIQAGKNQEVLLHFIGIDGSAHLSTVKVTSDDPAGAKDVKLKANQDVACLKVVPEKKIDFGFNALGVTATKELTLSSCGSSPVEISELKLTGDGQFNIAPESLLFNGKPIGANNPLTIGVGKQAKVQVQCTADSENKDANGNQQPFVGQIALTDNTIQSGKKVALSCYGSKTGCPTAVIVAPEELEPQSVLQLKGSSSFGFAGKSIKNFKWEVLKKPQGTAAYAFFAGDSVADPFFGVKMPKKGSPGESQVQVNVSGEYQFKLCVTDTDDVKNCACAVWTVVVKPGDAIHIELLWDTPGDSTPDNTGLGAGADLDLHFADQSAYDDKICTNPPEKCANGADCQCLPDLDKDGLVDPWFEPIFDCYWLNVSAQWGGSGNDDNPRLSLDDTDGWGPENLNVKTPQSPDVFSVGVHYWDAFQYGDSTATVNIYLQGLLVATFVQKMTQCDMWWVKKIKWPEATLLDMPGANLLGPSAGKITANYGNKQTKTLGAKCPK